MSRTIGGGFWLPALAVLLAACGGAASPSAATRSPTSAVPTTGAQTTAGSAATGQAATPPPAEQTPAAATPPGPEGSGMAFHVVVGFGPNAGAYDVTSAQPCFYDSRVSWSASDAISGGDIVLIDVLIPQGAEAARNINHVKVLFGGADSQVIYLTSDKQPPEAIVDDRGQTATLTLSGPAQQTGSGAKTGQLAVTVTCNSITRGG